MGNRSKYRTMKLLKEYLGENSYDLGLGKKILHVTCDTKSMTHKRKIKRCN